MTCIVILIIYVESIGINMNRNILIQQLMSTIKTINVSFVNINK